MKQLIIEHSILKSLHKEKIYDIKWHEDFKILIGKYINNSTNRIHISNIWNGIDSSVKNRISKRNKI